jgi:hypothetical protein
MKNHCRKSMLTVVPTEISDSVSGGIKSETRLPKRLKICNEVKIIEGNCVKSNAGPNLRSA